MIEPRRLRNADYWLLAMVVVLSFVGLVVIYSATKSSGAAGGGLISGDSFYYVRRQALALLLGLLGAVLVAAVDYESYGRWSPALYALALGSLAATLLFAEDIRGSQRWISLGFVRFQPSEFAKVCIIVTLARLLASVETWEGPGPLIWALGHVSLPMFLVLCQPDLGTAMVFGAIFMGMCYMAGMPARYLLWLGGLGVVGFAAVVGLSLLGVVSLLHDYQLERLLVFLDPYKYRMNSGYNVIQSMIAVGSGGFFGKGLGQGTQTQLNFIPAHHTDFVFSVLAEELGFAGALIVLVMYLVVLLRGLKIGATAKDSLGRLIATGVVSMLAVHLVVNVGMTLGLMPVTGLPLPFISYGRSAYVSTMLGIGLLESVAMRRRKLMFKSRQRG